MSNSVNLRSITDTFLENAMAENNTPAWLSQVANLQSEGAAKAVEAVETKEGKQEVITDTKAVGASLAAIADAMDKEEADE